MNENDDELELIKNLLSPKEFRKCEIIFNNDKRFKKEWSCFLKSNTSWIQLFHDILLLYNGIRSSVLIDYNVPEWNEFCQFLNHLKSNSSNSSLLSNIFKNIKLIYLDDYLFFLINIESILIKSEIDLSNSFSNYKFIDINSNNQLPIVMSNLEDIKETLSNLINILKLNNNNNNNNNNQDSVYIDLTNYSKELNLENIYFPILSGWFCEYPIIYCNSGGGIDKFDNNNLCGIELIKIELQLQLPFNNEILQKVQSIQRICSFTYPTCCYSSSNDKDGEEDLKIILNNFENKIINRFNSSSIINKFWKDLKFIKESITMTTIRL